MNITILNSIGVLSRVVGEPLWARGRNGHMIEVMASRHVEMAGVGADAVSAGSRNVAICDVALGRVARHFNRRYACSTRSVCS